MSSADSAEATLGVSVALGGRRVAVRAERIRIAGAMFFLLAGGVVTGLLGSARLAQTREVCIPRVASQGSLPDVFPTFVQECYEVTDRGASLPLAAMCAAGCVVVAALVVARLLRSVVLDDSGVTVRDGVRRRSIGWESITAIEVAASSAGGPPMLVIRGPARAVLRATSSNTLARATRLLDAVRAVAGEHGVDVRGEPEQLLPGSTSAPEVHDAPDLRRERAGRMVRDASGAVEIRVDRQRVRRHAGRAAGLGSAVALVALLLCLQPREVCGIDPTGHAGYTCRPASNAGALQVLAVGSILGVVTLGLATWRRLHQRAVLEPDALLVCNGYRTRVVPWSDVRAVTIAERGGWRRPVLAAALDRRVVPICAAEARTFPDAELLLAEFGQAARARGLRVRADTATLLFGRRRTTAWGVRRSGGHAAIRWRWLTPLSFLVWTLPIVPAMIATDGANLWTRPDDRAGLPEGRAYLVLAGLAVATALLHSRMVLLGVFLDEGGLKIRRLLLTRTIRWNDLKEIGVGARLEKSGMWRPFLTFRAKRWSWGAPATMCSTKPMRPEAILAALHAFVPPSVLFDVRAADLLARHDSADLSWQNRHALRQRR